jgi:hypothetical protein
LVLADSAFGIFRVACRCQWRYDVDFDIRDLKVTMDSFPIDLSHSVTGVLPTLVAPKPPKLRRLSAKTSDKYPNHNENQVALGASRAGFV